MEESEHCPTSSLCYWSQLDCANRATTKVAVSDETANEQGWTRASIVCATLQFRCSRMLGIPDAVVMALVGHESAAMSHRYTHVGNESLVKAADALPEL